MMAAALEQPSFNNKAAPNGSANTADAASITPPQSANGKKEVPEGVPSELSDLELDPKNGAAQEHASVEEEEEEIEPDHFYGGGRIPVFKPVCDDPTGVAVITADDVRVDHGAVSGFPEIHQQS